jgi:hypothetical protein
MFIGGPDQVAADAVCRGDRSSALWENHPVTTGITSPELVGRATETRGSANVI